MAVCVEEKQKEKQKDWQKDWQKEKRKGLWKQSKKMPAT